MVHLLFFSVDSVRCALPLTSIRLVSQMVRLTAAPDATDGRAGTINLHGKIIPVYSIRSFFGMPDRSPKLNDMLAVVQAGPDSIALWIDETHLVRQSTTPDSPAEQVVKGSTVVPGAEADAEGTITFVDLPLFLAGRTNAAWQETLRSMVGPQEKAAEDIQENSPADAERVRAVLAERAGKLARAEPGVPETELIDVLRFQLAYSEYALEMRYIKEVILTGEITPVPGAPAFISGICAVRGQIISLVDLRVLFSLPERGLTDLNRVIVITDGKITFGILADNITGIGTVLSDRMVPPAPGPGTRNTRSVKGIVDGTLMVLDGGLLLADPAMIIDEP